MPDRPTRSGVRTWGLRLLQLGLTVLVTWFVASRVGLSLDHLSRVDLAAWRPRWNLLAVASGVLLVGYLISAWLWGLLVRELGGPRVPASASVPIFFAANLGRYVPGKVWQIAGLAWLARSRGVSPSTSTAAAVLGQGAALAGATLVGLGTLLGGGPALRRWGLAAATVIVVALALAALPAVRRRGAELWFRLARKERPENLGLGPGFALRWVTFYTLNWIVYAGAFWILVRSFDLPGGPVAIGSAFAAAYVLGYVAVFAPAGIGIRESFLVAFLQPAMGVGAAGAVAIVARVWSTLVEVVPAAMLAGSHWIVERRRGREGG